MINGTSRSPEFRYQPLPETALGGITLRLPPSQSVESCSSSLSVRTLHQEGGGELEGPQRAFNGKQLSYGRVRVFR